MNYIEHIKKIEEYISDADRIANLGLDGWNGRLQLDAKIANFIRITFSDFDFKLQEYEKGKEASVKYKKIRNTRGIRVTVLDKEETQALTIQRIRWYLDVLKEELNLKNVKVEDSKLLKLKEAVEEKEIESQRREKVAETKFYGAAIEIIDKLRDELRSREQLLSEIKIIKTDIIEIKETLKKLTEEEVSQHS